MAFEKPLQRVSKMRFSLSIALYLCKYIQKPKNCKIPYIRRPPSTTPPHGKPVRFEVIKKHKTLSDRTEKRLYLFQLYHMLLLNFRPVDPILY